MDVFGDPNNDGSGTAWDYTDGWAYRVARTTATGQWVPSHWSFSGANALDTGCGTADASGCSASFPRATYLPPYSPPPYSPPPSTLGSPTPPGTISTIGVQSVAPAPAAPGSAYVATVAVAFTLGGSVSEFDAVSFEARLLARFTTATRVKLTVSAGSVVVVCTLFFLDSASAVSAASELQATSPSAMTATWFGGSVIVEEVTPPVVGAAELPADSLATGGGGSSWAVVAAALGTVGGVLVLLALLLGCYCMRRRAKARMPPKLSPRSAKEPSMKGTEHAQLDDERSAVELETI